MKLLFKFFIIIPLLCLTLMAAFVAVLKLDWSKEKIKQEILSYLQKEGIEASIGSIEGDLPFKLNLKDITLKKDLALAHIDTIKIRIAFFPLLRKEISIPLLEFEHISILGFEKKYPFSCLLNQFSFSTSCSGSFNSWSALFQKKVSLHPITGSFQAHFPEGSFTTSFSLNENGLFFLKNMALKTDALCLKGSYCFNFSFLPQYASFSFLLPHLSKIDPLLQGILEGNGLYDKKTLLLSFDSPELSIDSLLYTQTKGSIHAVLDKNRWKGSLDLHATHPDLPLDVEATFFSSFREILLQNFSIKIADSEIGGHGTLFPSAASQSELSFFVKAPNIALFSPLFPKANLKGAVRATVLFKDKSATFYALLKNGSWKRFFSSELSLSGYIDNLFSSPSPNIKIEGKSTHIKDVLLENFQLNLANCYSIDIKGFWKDCFQLASEGNVSWEKEGIEVEIKTLKACAFATDFNLQKPCFLKKEGPFFFAKDVDVLFTDGFLLASLDSKKESFVLKATHFPLNFLSFTTPLLSLEGKCSIDLEIEKNLARANIMLERAYVLPTGKKTPFQTKGNLQLHLNNSCLQANAQIIASNEQFLELNATLPIIFKPFSFDICLEKEKPFAASLVLEGHLEDIFDFVNMGSGTASGLISCNFKGSKTLSSPAIQGNLEIQNGSYQNYLTGMFFKEISAKANAEKDVLYFHSIQAKDLKKGEISGNGALSFKNKNPFSFSSYVQDVKVLELDWLTLFSSGTLYFKGNQDELLIKGNLNISKAEINIPDEFPADFPILEVKYINQPSYLKNTHIQKDSFYNFNYDILLSSLEKTYPIALSGRGLSGDLSGNLHITGQNLSIDAEGGLHLHKGKFNFAGKDFTLTHGKLTFIKTPTPQAYLNLSGTLSTSEMTVTALLNGPLDKPVLSLQSIPSLPTSSILARLLFNKDVSELSAAQALQLANTLVSLSGNSGPTILEKIRKTLGIDQLNITSSGELDEIKVQIGKYLTKGVLVTLTQGAESSQVVVEVELKGGFIFQAETQEDDQGKFTLKWNKNY